MKQEEINKAICELAGVEYREPYTCKNEDVCYAVCRESDRECDNNFKTTATKITLKILVKAMFAINRESENSDCILPAITMESNSFTVHGNGVMKDANLCWWSNKYKDEETALNKAIEYVIENKEQ